LLEQLFKAATESGAEHIELTSTEVRRRLAEVQVEAVVIRAAREISPISLHTEFAHDLVVRTDAPFKAGDDDDKSRQKSAERTLPIIIVDKPDDVFTIDAVDKVKLRRGYSNTEKIKDQKR
jgi:hypothetical protein